MIEYGTSDKIFIDLKDTVGQLTYCIAVPWRCDPRSCPSTGGQPGNFENHYLVIDQSIALIEEH